MKLHKCIWVLGLAAAPLAAQDAREIALENADFEQVGEPGSLPGWTGTANAQSGYRFVHSGRDGEEGKRFARLESVEAEEAAPFGAIYQMVDPENLRGRRVRLTARVRLAEGASEHLGLWLRVDRPGDTLGYFDNMKDRPIRSREWAEYTIEGDVAPDATRVMLGVLMTGKGAAEFDTVRLSDIGAAQGTPPPVQAARPRFGPPRDSAIEGDAAPAPVTPRGMENLAAFARLYGLVRWFHPADTAADADWDRVAIAAIPLVERAATSGELASALRAAFAPLAPQLVVEAGAVEDLPAMPALSGDVRRWKHVGLGGTGRGYSSVRETVPAAAQRPALREALPGGVSFVMPLTVGAAQEDVGTQVIDPAKPEGWVPAGFDRTTRLAATIAGWAMLDHFYPYWDTVDVDWDAELRARLAEAAIAGNDDAFAGVLERLVEPLADGHGRIIYRSRFRAGLPLEWQWIEDRLIITAVGEGAEGLEVGMAVDSIDGVAIETVLDAEMAQISGSAQNKRNVAVLRARWFSGPVQRVLGVTTEGAGRREVALASVPGDLAYAVQAERPEVVEELEPGILYVDLTRWDDTIFEASLDRMAQAKGIVFDLRGYPKGSPDWIDHLITQPSRSPDFQRPVFTAPDAAATYPDSGGWQLEPKQPHVGAERVFLTDARAVSYSESLLGTVQGNGLGPIIGSPTAGANGNRSDFLLPGGYGLSFTGMRVTNHDGTLQHIRGVIPDIAVAPTIAGIRAGRDEVLEAGLAELRRRMAD